MTYAPKSAPKSAPQNAPRVSGSATQGEHGLWYIAGTQYTYTRRNDGVFLIYAPGCPEDGMEFATSADP
jgi:hypothetical protein